MHTPLIPRARHRAPPRARSIALLAAPLFFCTLLPPAARAVTRQVSTPAALVTAVGAADPGDEILLAPGVYALAENILCDRAGTAQAPIVVRSDEPLQAKIRFDAVSGFRVAAPHWRFEDLDIEGVCAEHSKCEHAFQIIGKADDTIVRGCRMHGYNAMIKGNGDPVGPGGAMVFPDDVLIEYCELFNPTPRQTGNPVTPIDVVGGRRWIVRGNFIHDHHKAKGDQISYAAFFKGNSRDGLFERNLVVCELLHKGGIRLGLSFGGGGSHPNKICEEGKCVPEHRGGVMRNNIIASCPADVGIYLNEAQDCEVHHNTLIDTTGIDVRFPASKVDLRNNLLTGAIRDRDGAKSERVANLENVTPGQLAAWFADAPALDLKLLNGSALVDKGDPKAAVSDDFCGEARDDGKPDIGAVEYGGGEICATTGVPPLPSAALQPEADAGGTGADAWADTGGAGVEADTGGAGVEADAAGKDGEVRPAGTVLGGDSGCSAGAGAGAQGAWPWLIALALVGIRPRRVAADRPPAPRAALTRPGP